MGITWCSCGTSRAIFTCLTSGIWWSPNSKELGVCYKNHISSGVHLSVTHINCTLTIFKSLNAIFYLLKS